MLCLRSALRARSARGPLVAPVTFVGASAVNGSEAVMRLDGALNVASFAVYPGRGSAPKLVPGDAVVLEMPVHEGAGMIKHVEVRGAHLLFLPCYSPDFTPIEHAWSKLETALRTVQVRTREALKWALDQSLVWITS